MKSHYKLKQNEYLFYLNRGLTMFFENKSKYILICFFCTMSLFLNFNLNGMFSLVENIYYKYLSYNQNAYHLLQVQKEITPENLCIVNTQLFKQFIIKTCKNYSPDSIEKNKDLYVLLEKRYSSDYTKLPKLNDGYEYLIFFNKCGEKNTKKKK